MRAQLVLAGRLWCGVLCAHAVTAQPSALEARLTGRLAAAFRKSGVPSVSVAVVADGKLAFAQALGMADIAAGRKAETSMRYPVGSISKQFTATALLLLAEQGKLSLDDRVSKYFPEYTRAADISIRQLLSHTSGYEDFAPQDYLIPEWTQPTTPKTLLDKWAKKPLNFEPGTEWQYSNTSYVLAAAIFEKAAGQSLTAFLREHIFVPLEMQSAGDCLPVGPGDPVPYRKFALAQPRPVAREESGWYYGAATLCMTPSDLARWDAALMTRRLLSAQSYRELTQEVRLANGNATHYALGIQIGELNDAAMLYHTGEVSGFLAANYVFPARNVAVAVLSNEDASRFADPLARELAAVILQPVSAQRVTVSEQEVQKLREILEGLQRGRIERSLFTSNANSYFSDEAVTDFKGSLADLGRLRTITRTGESLRGGMTHRGYRAEFAKKVVALNVYVMPDGKFEQFLVTEP